jgi:hypothetical protein
MSKHLMFIGDPGPNAREMLAVLRNVGLTAKRLDASDDLIAKLSPDPPVALLFDAETHDLKSLVSTIRAERLLSELPLLLRLQKTDPDFLIEAFKWGVDDFFVNDAIEHFAALVSAIEKQDGWRTVRAPAGQIVLAHADRLERAKLGRILRRNGFDTYFAGNSGELDAAIRSQQARAIIVSCEIPGERVRDVVGRLAKELPKPPPFVIVVKSEKMEEVRADLPSAISATLFEDGADAEGITFLLNEILAPPPTGTRRSPRVLFGTPVSFVHKGGTRPTTGFTFNINYGGIYIRTLASLPLQTKIEVSFRPPFGRGQVFADAQVVWRKQLGDSAGAASPPGMGVQFLDLWPADLAAYETGYNQLLEEAKSSTSIPTPPVASSE